MMRKREKIDVKEYWEHKVCGAVYGLNEDGQTVNLDKMARARYELEPYIPGFAEFPSARGKRMLEVGVGGGVDFSSWVMNGALAIGLDLTQAGVDMTRTRLQSLGAPEGAYQLAVGDAENLPFPSNTFELVYSFGVLHHSPNTQKALDEVYRVLKPGGTFKGMIYHVYCWVALMFWGRYSLLAGRPWKSPRQAMFEHLESPGTKTYTRAEAATMLQRAGFEQFKVSTKLGVGDLLINTPRTGYRGLIYHLFWKLYPRWFVRLCGDRWGMGLFIEATK